MKTTQEDNTKSNTSSPSSSRASEDTAKVLQDVKVKRVSSPVFQIAQHVRDIIYDGKLTPGTRLPSTRELSEHLSVDVSSVHRALSMLTQEGLLVRTPYVGTFVAQPPNKKLEKLAFYFANSSMGGYVTFARALLERVTRLGHRHNFSVEVFSDNRKESEREGSAPADLLRLARTRHIQGVVTVGVALKRFRWLESLPVPFAAISNPNQSNAYNWSRNEMAAKAVECLAERGCRKIGIITATLAQEDPDANAYQMGFYNGFVSAAAKAGLEIHPGRMIGRRKEDHDLSEMEISAFGHNAVNQMWRDLPASERPDGLFVYPDTMSMGILLALSDQRVKVPDDLRLVLHTHAEIPAFCPYPVDHIVVNVSDAAEALVRHIRYQLMHRQIESNILPCHLELSE